MNRSRVVSVSALLVLGVVATRWAVGSASGVPGTSPDAMSFVCCRPPQSEAVATVSLKHSLTLSGANRALSAAIAKARELKATGAIAVVDEGGHLLALQSLDGTFAAGATVSTGKARTAALFQKPTRVFEDSINGGRIALTAVGEMTPLRGGVPIMHQGMIVGGIGVSGAHNQAEDEEIALAGAAAIALDTAAAH